MIIKLDYHSDIPIYLQLKNEIIRGIGSGELKYGENLPTVRSLANDIQVNAMTVSKAYNLLKQEGFIMTDRRNGAKVLPIEDCSQDYQSSLADEISLIACKAVLKGMDKKEFMSMCERILHNVSYKNT